MTMIQLVHDIYSVLNRTKGFDVGYTNQSDYDGYMIIDCDKKRYAVKIVEIKNPSSDVFRDLDTIRSRF